MLVAATAGDFFLALLICTPLPVVRLPPPPPPSPTTSHLSPLRFPLHPSAPSLPPWLHSACPVPGASLFAIVAACLDLTVCVTAADL